MEEQTNQGMVCKCSHHSFISWLVMLFGAIFLLRALDILGSGLVDLAWPILVIVAGFMKMGSRKCKCC
ncbi:MAG: hypothetical protein AAB885_01550 [Patescibacteria group bacterium]